MDEQLLPLVSRIRSGDDGAPRVDDERLTPGATRFAGQAIKKKNNLYSFGAPVLAALRGSDHIALRVQGACRYKFTKMSLLRTKNIRKERKETE